jgi:hypothetical protein
MSPHHPKHPLRAPEHRPGTLAGYLALQREADLARAASRPHLSTPTGNSPLLRALAPAVGSRFRELLSRTAATRRLSLCPVTIGPARPARARLGTAPAEPVCCA